MSRFDLLASSVSADAASVPGDDTLSAEMNAFAAAFSRPRTTSITEQAFDQGLWQRGDVEVNLGAQRSFAPLHIHEVMTSGKGVVVASKQANQMAEFFASLAERMSKPDMDLATVRDIAESLHLASTEPEGVTYAEVDAGGVPALWCIPDGADAEHVLLHSHMGGTVILSMYSDRKAAGHIAKAAGARALVLDFRRSPEHKFPAQIDDVDSAYTWLLAQGYRPENIVSSGHSIGGNFAVSLAVRLRDKGAALPAAILSISPGFDTEMKNATLETNTATDKILSRPLMEFFRESWIGGTGVAFDDPRVNMLYADLTGLPPTMIYYGDSEMLAGEAVEFAARATDAGVDVSLHSVPAGQHSFIMGAGRVPEVDEAIEEMGRWLRSKLGLATLARIVHQ